MTNNTGPPYPPPPAPGSNALGSFVIGVSPLGDIAPFNFWQTVISQYANSPTIDALIESFDAAIDQTENFDLLYDNIWNVQSAQGYGLDVWGRIVGVSRALQVAVGDWFGFAEAQPGSQTFGFGAFYSGASLTQTYLLSDSAYRQLILAKAASNITNGSIPTINQILINLFPGRGNAYVTEGVTPSLYFGFAEAGGEPFGQAPFYSGENLGGMSMTYTFEFALTPVETSIVFSSGVLPKPAGVSATIVIAP